MFVLTGGDKMKKDEKQEKPDVVREVNLSGLNTSVHLMSTSAREDIDFLVAKGLKALEKIREDGERK